MQAYIELINNFLNNTLDTKTFETKYLKLFKNDENNVSDKEYILLEGLFWDVCDYCPEEDELFHPDNDITENELRSSAKSTLEELINLTSTAHK